MNYETLLGLKTKGTARLGARCQECSRLFDFNNETDATEWAYGHDCESVEE